MSDTVENEVKTDIYEMKEVDLGTIEELESAIAPGFIGFGCGCGGINIGIFCG